MWKIVLKRLLFFVIIIAVAAALIFTATYVAENRCDPAEDLIAKPVIYLYPAESMQVDVKLDVDGELLSTWPIYDNGWTVTAQPDGTLTDADGNEYSYLFWDARSDVEYDFSKGFCVAGEDTGEFLRETLSHMGLTPKEYNEFIVYWLPLMQENPYNLIAFQGDVYEESAELTITPEPDSMLRVFMAWKPLEEPEEIAPQTVEPFVREGFAVVEWGGSKVES